MTLQDQKKWHGDFIVKEIQPLLEAGQTNLLVTVAMHLTAYCSLPKLSGQKIIAGVRTARWDQKLKACCLSGILGISGFSFRAYHWTGSSSQDHVFRLLEEMTTESADRISSRLHICSAAPYSLS